MPQKRRKNIASTALIAEHVWHLASGNEETYLKWCRDHRFGVSLKKSPSDLAEERKAWELEKHIDFIAGGSTANYLEWCRNHGLTASLRKSMAEIQDEDRIARNEITQESLRKGKRARDPEFAIADGNGPGYPDPQSFPEQTPSRAVAEYYSRLHVRSGTVDPSCELSLEKALAILRRTSPQLLEDYESVTALLALLSRQDDWIRPLEGWKPRTHNTRRQLASLLRHLLASYGVPAFMDSAYTNPDAPTTYRQWFVDIGQGRNIRKSEGLPFPLTKAMAHAFLEAPDDLTVGQALRWAQVVGLGGDPRMARALMGTRISEPGEHEAFWSSVVQFLARHPMLDTIHYGPIIDYLQNQRFDPEPVIEDGRIVQRPAQPNLSMRGRNPDTLLRHVAGWHRGLGRMKGRAYLSWDPSGIRSFSRKEKVETGDRLWTITELLNSNHLRAEGSVMHHCVYTYDASCASGRTSIWSMRKFEQGKTQNVLTIEVQLSTRTIVQARGAYNARPKPKDADLLRRWAQKERLKIASYV